MAVAPSRNQRVLGSEKLDLIVLLIKCWYLSRKQIRISRYNPRYEKVGGSACSRYLRGLRSQGPRRSGLLCESAGGHAKERNWLRWNDAFCYAAVWHDELDAANKTEQNQHSFIQLWRPQHIRLHRHASAGDLDGRLRLHHSHSTGRRTAHHTGIPQAYVHACIRNGAPRLLSSFAGYRRRWKDSGRDDRH